MCVVCRCMTNTVRLMSSRPTYSWPATIGCSDDARGEQPTHVAFYEGKSFLRPSGLGNRQVALLFGMLRIAQYILSACLQVWYRYASQYMIHDTITLPYPRTQYFTLEIPRDAGDGGNPRHFILLWGTPDGRAIAFRLLASHDFEMANDNGRRRCTASLSHSRSA
jgi:hypothetical protein